MNIHSFMVLNKMAAKFYLHCCFLSTQTGLLSRCNRSQLYWKQRMPIDLLHKVAVPSHFSLKVL